MPMQHPSHTGGVASNAGAQKAVELLERIENLVKESARGGKDFDPSKATELLELAFDLPQEMRSGVASVIAEYIGNAMSGFPPEMNQWKPLALAA